jgi:hypothetical protein
LDYQENRQKVIEWTKEQLTGYPLKDDLLNGDNPINLFKIGCLSGVVEKEQSEIEEVDSEIEELSSVNSKIISEAKSVKKNPRYMPTSSASFSFYVTGKEIELRIYHKAVGYEAKKIRDEIAKDRGKGQFLPEKMQEWKKILLSGPDGDEVIFTPDGDTRYIVFDGKAKIDAIWRPQEKGGYIVTISISNKQLFIQHARNGEELPHPLLIIEQAKSTLFEVECKCIFEKGEVENYPSMDRDLLSDEEKEIELRYKDNLVLAIGHGVGTNWKKNVQGNMEIWADFMPCVEVPTITTKTATDVKTLSFEYLKDARNPEVIKSLKEFVEDYKKWGVDQNNNASNELEEDINTANELIKKQQIAIKRMEQGVDLIANNSKVRKSFSIANEAMLLQMQQSNINSPSWRPFQLGFILMTLESTIHEDSSFRDTLDLIWFPTGGGKTEAYLGLMAFLFIYRRLSYQNTSGGTVAIMRYTLRLLSSQQFLRATKVICALELIRKENIEELGSERFSVGLWVGRGVSPNTFHQAFEIKKEGDIDRFGPFVLHECPWCSSTFKAVNYVSTENSFHFTCTKKHCDFGGEEGNILPCNVVDEAHYKQPPSLLIATVDKFARLTWSDKPNCFFKKNGNRPPELIIQDELHLISGALGSIVGLYEVAIDSILASFKVYPKYVASTATIKNAKDQVKLLFGREMSIFPPSGLRANDSYFAKTISIKDKPGRMYVGFLDSNSKRRDSLTHIASTTLLAPNVLFSDEKDFLDSWWTQVVYHSSLRELGSNRTLYQENIPQAMEKLRKRINVINKNGESSSSKKILSRELNIKTLNGNQSPKHNQTVFTDLNLSNVEFNSVDVALCTELISVGVDVDRLSLMIINGQPSTTAEYIQASSRVGRSDIPGVVFVNYYKTQSRSLSHYENFRSYHDSFYRYVEPSSITPFTYQARSRAIHAVVICAIRHSVVGLLANEEALNFNPENDNIKRVILKIKNRCGQAINNENVLNEVKKNIDDVVNTWSQIVSEGATNRRRLAYDNNVNGQLDKSLDSLLCDFNDGNYFSAPPWPTLQSMRNIENMGAIETKNLND